MTSHGDSSPHLSAVFQALFVTFLWSTSWVLIKWGLDEIPPLIFAGLRYGLGFLCLLPFAFTLWNCTLRFLAATHSSIINSTMITNNQSPTTNQRSCLCEPL
ncbi:MAG TPA: DMT family transporter [Anaerolineales bacterium]|nr:DMT family transporter [Anaerolineales bacterium]